MLGDQPSNQRGIATLVPTKSDAERAAEIRTDIMSKLDAVCKAMDEARRDGFVASFQLGLDGMNRQFISTLVIAKHF